MVKMEKQAIENKFPTFAFETALQKEGYQYVVGVDEAGRGPGAGPVIAAAVHIPDQYVETLLDNIKDSKKMSAKRREEWFDVIKETCVVGIGTADNRIVDLINVLEATKNAMVEALGYHLVLDYVLVDGSLTLGLDKVFGVKCKNIIKGDNISLSIAAASIIAKVTRDRIMQELHEEYPVYGWDRNKGYLTKAHIEAIKLYGPSEYHRISFNKVGSGVYNA